MSVRFVLFVAAGFAGVAAINPAQTPAQAPNARPGVEVLARGPVHEAFAATLEVQTQGGAVVRRAPPDVIEELPPDQKPAGDNVQWISGYWHWDEERDDYIWISGFWRVPPPGRVWVPGSWRDTRNGFQWVHGFWQESIPEQQRADVDYLPPPPNALELTPSVPAPTETHVYVPGCWVWRNRYVWRPGFWVDHRPGWIWVPAHYRWTPAGYIFIEGYWDLPLADRGVLFAPVYVPPAVFVQPQYVYTPTIVVSEPALYTSLFVRRGWGCYYFGDYFENRYTEVGFSAWASNVRGSGFGVSVSFGRSVGYDPLWDYYRVHHRHDPAWAVGVRDCYAGRFNGTVARPPRTLVQQNVVVNNITNVTNNNVIVNNVTNNTNTINNTVVNNTNTVNNNQMLLTNLTNVQQTNQRIALKPLAAEDRVKEQTFAKEVRGVAQQRKQLESTLAEKNPVPTTGGSQAVNTTVKSVRLDVPKSAVVRAQMPTERKDIELPTAATATKVQQKPTGTASSLPPATSALKPEPAKTPEPVMEKVSAKPAPLTGKNATPVPATPPTTVKTPPTTKPENKPLPTPVPSPAPNPTPSPAPTPNPATGTKPMPPVIGKPSPAPAPSAKPLPPAPAPNVNPMSPAPAPSAKPDSRPLTPAPLSPAPSMKPAPANPIPVPNVQPRPLPPASSPPPVTSAQRPAPLPPVTKPSAPPVMTSKPAPPPAAPNPPPLVSSKPTPPPAATPSLKPSAPAVPSNKPAPPPPSEKKDEKKKP